MKYNISIMQHYVFSINVKALDEFARSCILVSFLEELFYQTLRILLLVTAVIGYGFYLWFLFSSKDQTQQRLLNILNGYLSVACLGFCPFAYSYEYVNEGLVLFYVRSGIPFIIAITTSFLLISFATILNHFKPDMYLDLSLTWRHKIAVPTMIVFCILLEQLLNLPCIEDFVRCEVSNVRKFFMIPSTVTSLLGQLIVIVDVFFGWRNIFKALRRFFSSNSAAPLPRVGTEMVATTASHNPPNLTPVLDHHVVSKEF